MKSEPKPWFIIEMPYYLYHLSPLRRMLETHRLALVSNKVEVASGILDVATVSQGMKEYPQADLVVWSIDDGHLYWVNPYGALRSRTGSKYELPANGMIEFILGYQGIAHMDRMRRESLAWGSQKLLIASRASGIKWWDP